MLLSGKTYKATSEFFIDYSIQCADSNIMDVKIAISKAQNAMEELQSMSVENRKQILMKFIKLISSDEEFEKHITLMSGIPISSSRNQAQELVSFFKDQIDELFVNYEVKNNNIYSRFDPQSIFTPKQGIVYVPLPLLAVRAIGMILPISILLGMPIIVKSNKIIVSFLFKIADILKQLGYPAAGFNIIDFNQMNENASSLNNALINASDVVWTFGDDNSIGYEKTNNQSTGDDVVLKDLFYGKTIINHPYHNHTAIVCNGGDIERSIDIIVESCISFPFECSLKSLYIVEECYEEVKQKLIEKFFNLAEKTGNPLYEGNQIGFCDRDTKESVKNRIIDLEKMGLINILVGVKYDQEQENVSFKNHKMNPLLLETNDELVDILTASPAVGILTIMKCTDINDGIEKINKVLDKKRIGVTFLGKDLKETLPEEVMLKANAIHLKVNVKTVKPDLTCHDGRFYFLLLTELKRILRSE
ncbi:aldehyde dehydrogenase family protein [Clostridium beijerinckii]|nr:aldehyde dehydrogenase family protein [Clostridium beijerinckii]MBF7807462.1 aldehyde dehydrogenase [Clostridium beijerinckii]NOW88094.1 acyl-CoA reductase-like NAD-dependent aldehyde dehydrogenase [Clostridium beijerinckii]NRT66500.1 acyl-CoA reductase-like NAD-dependent aldehyde dehydrogenase [Clostridium beijerinckii]NRU51308.1 acyl-CoA reductase-like NAD-dependent aldehyde dehydrogenase [Clostridium beijerinckii]NRZ30549.1 acyl-CoA reductase-like NAD-dependent aldehyde dehydrogenase [Cl